MNGDKMQTILSIGRVNGANTVENGKKMTAEEALIAANRAKLEASFEAEVNREAVALDRKRSLYSVQPLGRRQRAGHAPPVARQDRAAEPTIPTFAMRFGGPTTVIRSVKLTATTPRLRMGKPVA